MFVGFVFCHFGRFSQHTGHSDKYQASQNNWWKVTLPLQSCCWFGSSLTMKCSYGEIGRWELIDKYLVLKGMFFLHSLHYSLFFPFTCQFSGSFVSGSAHGWVSWPWHKRGKECGAGSRGGMGPPHQQWPAPGLALLLWRTLLVIIWPY